VTGPVKHAARPVNWFTPLPPARNGIADYSAMLLAEMVKLAPCTCYCEDALAETPEGVEVRDPVQAFRHLRPDDLILNQIGNNRGHVFVLEALRRHGGVVSLHDLSLLYLYELATPRTEELFAHLLARGDTLTEIFSRQWKEAGLKTLANYTLFDMTSEVLRRADAVIVHSEYARRKLAAVHGAEATKHLAVVPHFAKKLSIRSEQARHQLGIGSDEVLIVTSGFATRYKRFDWLVESLAQLRAAGRRFRWIHAGEERPQEYDLTREIASRPGLSDCAGVTGYLDEDQLDAHIAAADILVNLRFPSVGESSGTLARAFAAGRCCVVNDTAAYTEIPRDVVVHVPVFDTVACLARALDQLIAEPALRAAFGQRAHYYARTALSLGSVARSYLDVIQEAERRRPAPVAAPTQAPLRVAVEAGQTLPKLSTLVGGQSRPFEVTIWFRSADDIAARSTTAPDMVRRIIGPDLKVDGLRFVRPPRADDSGRIGLLVTGLAA